MVAIITADIIASRKLVNQEKWLSPLKNLLATWGNSPKDCIGVIFFKSRLQIRKMH
jgi:hypothetical protein